MNDSSLFSAQWYRVRHVRPQLASDVQAVRHVYRGRIVYILHRKATSRYQKLDQHSYALIDRLDGKLSIEDVWQEAIASSDEMPMTQDEWIRLLAELHNADLLVVDRRVPAESLFKRRRKSFALDRSQRYLNPLFLRFALHDPDHWLNRLEGLATFLYSRFCALVWLCLIFFASLVALTHGEQLFFHLSDPGLLSGYNLLLLLCIYPPIKAIHELAHALAVKKTGGGVHEFGIALMVFFPIPYIDASASSIFPEKRDRMLVSAAGILAELALSAIGILVWANSEGLIADIGLAVFLIAGVSSFVFNGNPLLKFDGYYILSDWLEIPNMYRYSRQTVLSLLRSKITGSADPLKLRQDPVERYCLISYGLLSGFYRTVLMISIAWMLSRQWFFIGLLLAMFTCYLFLVKPAISACRTVYKDKAFRSGRSILVLSILPVVAGLGCSSMSVRHSSVLPGVVWLPDEALIRAKGSCEVIKASVVPGQLVEQGDELFVCTDPDTSDRVSELVALVDELKVRRAGVMARDPLAMEAINAELKASEGALHTARELLSVEHRISKTDGVFDVIGDSTLVGRYLQRGDIIGYIVPQSERTIRVAVDEFLMHKIDEKLIAVEIRLQNSKGFQRVYETDIARRSPVATRQVDTLALTSAGGGPHRADPEGDGRQTLSPVYDLELHWPEHAQTTSYVGSHVDIRFVFSDSTLLARVWEGISFAMNRIQRT